MIYFFTQFGKILAVVIVFRLLWGFCLYLYTFFIRPLLQSDPIWSPSKDKWAIITGGTDGIGLAYTKQLAGKGYPVMIISRNMEKLTRVKHEIEIEFPDCPGVKVVAFDFSHNDPIQYDLLETLIDELAAIDVLVNNVGISFNTADYFTVINEREPHLFTSMVNVNIVSVVKMTQFILERMKQQKRGLILNIGSLSALSPVPLLALYSSTKAFVDNFTKCLVEEMTDYPNIIIQSILPGFVSTKMSHLRASWMVPTAERYVRSALATIGRTSRTYGYWWHSCLGTVYESMQYVLGQRFNSKLAYKELLKLRSRYYRIKRIPDTFN